MELHGKVKAIQDGGDRIGFVVEIISDFGSVTLRINEDGTNERWISAIDGFNQHFNQGLRTQSISAILRSS